MKKIAISQPRYLPSCNYIERMVISDVFVVLDNVQHQKRAYEHRNKIKTNHGEHWLSIPIDRKHSSSKIIKDLLIHSNEPWENNHLNSFRQFYARTPHYNEIISLLETYYSKKRKTLIEAVMDMLYLIIDYLDLEVNLELASDYVWHTTGDDLLIEMTKKFSGDVYISGPNGRNYIDKIKFKKSNIKLLYHDYDHPIYDQMWGSFISYMTIWDLLFYKGRESKNIIKKGRLENA